MDYIYNPVTNLFEGPSQNIASLGQVMWHITNACRLNCSICFTRQMRKCSDELTADDILSYVLLLKKLGVQKIDISGGEPLLYEALPFLVEQCTLNSIAITVTTSGVGLEENLKWVGKHWMLFSRIIVSLDGPKNIHNELRRSSIAYSSFEEFCSLLNTEGCKNLRINTVVTKSICAGECGELCEVISSIHPLEWCIVEPFPINKTEYFDDLTIGRETFRMFFAKSAFLMQKSGVRLIRRVNEEYGSYWALYPDGYLYYSHDNHTYDTKILLCEENYTRICRLVRENKQLYIKNYGGIDMSERESIVKIQNLELDGVSPLMMNDLKEQLSHCDGVQSIQAEKVLHEGEKCDLTLALSLVASVATGIVASAIYDYLKSVFSRRIHPKNYQWKLMIQSDKTMKVSVYEKNGVVLVDVQNAESEE